MTPNAPDATMADACFRATGDTIPLDHGYILFGALSRLVPALHERPAWGVHTIPGRQAGPGLLGLDGKSVVRVRLPPEEVGALFPLVGAELDLAGHALRLGALTLRPLVPAASLWAKFVTLRGHLEPESFLDTLRRQLAEIAHLGQDPERIELAVGQRRILRIKDKNVVGFTVEAAGLEAQASLRLQQVGLGGRRHMGAGLFIPKTRRSA